MTPRRTLAVLFTVLLFSPHLPARTHHDWANVEKLRPGTEVRILLWSGGNLSGHVYNVSQSGLQLASCFPPQTSGSWLHTIDRATIRKIVSNSEPKLPDPGKWMAVGAVAGGLVGVTTGGFNRNGESYNGFTGALGGAGMGAFAALPVVTVVGLHRAVHHK
jgi:hypothetical protein